MRFGVCFVDFCTAWDFKKDIGICAHRELSIHLQVMFLVIKRNSTLVVFVVIFVDTTTTNSGRKKVVH